MQRRYELTFSMNYVKDWTYVEAFRELFQNAIDNEIQNPENKMLFAFDEEEEKIRICNKLSKLEVETLLLGETTKADDANTIGQHGEGYKVAFVVLLREGKTITVYNYGKREIWKVRAVKSKRYGDKLIPVVNIEKEAIWKKVPDNDLTIEIGNVTKEEYEQLKIKNLNLRDTPLKSYEYKGYGRLLLDEKEAGNIYVKGLYVSNVDGLKYGYDFEPSRISLDRDRKLVKTFDIAWEASRIWSTVISSDVENKDEILKLLSELTLKDALDVSYLSSMYSMDTRNFIAREFKKEYGHMSIPVTSTAQYEIAKEKGYNPIISSSNLTNLYSTCSILHDFEKATKKVLLKDELLAFISKIEGKLTSEELKEITSIHDRMTE